MKIEKPATLWLKKLSYGLLFLTAIVQLTLTDLGNAAAVIEVDHPEKFDRVLALSDVHGMAQPLNALLTHAGVIGAEGHWIAQRTLVIVVGDSIDKGPESLEVLDLWIRLEKEAKLVGGQVIHLLGNHEAEFLAYGKKSTKADTFKDELKSKGLRVKDLLRGDVPEGQYLLNMPVAAHVGHWLFCHAGLFPPMSLKDFDKRATALMSTGDYDDPLFVGEESLLEAKNWWEKHKHRKTLEARLEEQGIYGLVMGHQPKALHIDDQIGATDRGRIVKVDCGMAPIAGAHAGQILQFDHPSEMNQMKTPTMSVIPTVGSTKVLEIQ